MYRCIPDFINTETRVSAVLVRITKVREMYDSTSSGFLFPLRMEQRIMSLADQVVAMPNIQTGAHCRQLHFSVQCFEPARSTFQERAVNSEDNRSFIAQLQLVWIAAQLRLSRGKNHRRLLLWLFLVSLRRSGVV